MADYHIGLMSGTSMDGVDGVVLDKDCQKIITSICLPYSASLKTHLQRLSQSGKSTLEHLAQVDIEVAQLFAKTANQLIKQARLDKKDICAIGSHGQTIYHQGGVYSMQIGHGAFIAEQTGITTVADFRLQDIAAGGQGAPLTPLYHQHMLDKKDGVIINLGGIANITTVKNNKVFGFDTGPANTLLDVWIKQEKNLDYDKDGVWAQSGVVNKTLLNILLEDAYFQAPAPKSTGPEYFNLGWLGQRLPADYQAQDIARTLLELSAVSISQHIPTDAIVYLCGGGAHNFLLVERLKTLNPQSAITTTSDLGIDPDFVEAAAFAFFAKQTLEGKPSNLPLVTGACGTRILGGIYQYQGRGC
ncbi:Anhydro-N-acetylmuramic acid kinase [Bathymodiolus heckerae thiotrophic gill symbiont]|uniref:anhydro-N-acetylmuramic acid kinase n=1 Tax=Bathymodiolus heckerae thiotrophic gill symbiont TaxID=1052212 RepID=UPI0010B1A4B2|nr:anhydro-N-acetylmuramic acid kinase [Bathymodiolus heckerae thiotrophic gill symbiont]CAC9436987.1 Anhydro-N-acetylmuramic acid kinase (EC 2.7.1.170) [uncultured Gammaproteobacteria bacterium]SMN13145.1 Anhydro-N-acetylmuramic acid kinase [Bathymodiolus heckerae thiotrophic gill symbiont]SMN15398.1 Anhydro-N-acetylmuramic acid kinase [uncultured Candidatus Thioglobus sp.]